MFKKNKKVHEYCTKCGKPLSQAEIKKSASKCENCLGKIVKMIKRTIVGVGAGVTATTGIVIYFATRGKKGKL